MVYAEAQGAGAIVENSGCFRAAKLVDAARQQEVD